MISDNHIGDWGTQFGMIIYGYKHFRDEAALAAKPVAELTRLYRLVNALVEYHETQQEKIPALKLKIQEAAERVARLDAQAAPERSQGAQKGGETARPSQSSSWPNSRGARRPGSEARSDRSRPELGPLLEPHADIARAVLAETAALHGGDPTNSSSGGRFLPLPRGDRGDLRAAGRHVRPHARRKLLRGPARGVVEDLGDKGLARESEGAICVFLEGRARR